MSDSPRLSIAANQLFARCDNGEIIIYIPTICLVESIYLQEKGRIPSELKTQLDRAAPQLRSRSRIDAW